MFNKRVVPIDRPTIVGSGLVVLDIILNNGDPKPIFSAGGTCGNVIAGLSHLGWRSICVSRSGDDIAGDLLIEDLSNNGVDVSRVTREKKLSTPRIVERLSSDGQFAKHSFLLRCPTCGAYLPRFQSPRLNQISDIPRADMIPDVFFFDRVTPSTLKLAEYFRDNGSLIFFEPGKVKSFDRKTKAAIKLSHIIKVAGIENPPMFCAGKYDVGLEELEQDAPALVLKTIGKHGLLFRCGSDHEWHYQSSFRPVELHDCCGAGDWCSVGLLFRLKQLAIEQNSSILDLVGNYEPIRISLEFAQMLSALSCSFVGARGLSNALTINEIIKGVSSSLDARGTIDPSFINDISKMDLTKSKGTMQVAIGEVCPTCLL